MVPGRVTFSADLTKRLDGLRIMVCVLNVTNNVAEPGCQNKIKDCQQLSLLLPV